MFMSSQTLLRSLYRRPAGEPRGLYRFFCVGILLIVVGGISTVMFGVRKQLWEFEGTPTVRESDRCKEQFADRKEREGKADERLKISEQRVVKLTESLKDASVSSFTDAPSALAFEKKLQPLLKRELDSLKVETIRGFLPHFIAGLLLAILISLTVARLAARQAYTALGGWARIAKSADWLLPYWFWVALIFGTHLSREVLTSILQTTDKSWFAWSSFCVSSGSWTLMLVPALGVAMVVAYPATILWHFSRASNPPLRLNKNDKDGQWGVGSYVLFLQTWAILSLAFVLLPGALWLRGFLNDPRFSGVYVLPGSILFVAILVISGRMILRAISIRRSYQIELGKLGETWQEIQDQKPPPDPTINFLGEHWWKLPSLIVGMFALLWLIVQQIGVADRLLEFIGLR